MRRNDCVSPEISLARRGAAGEHFAYGSAGFTQDISGRTDSLWHWEMLARMGACRFV
ncbi:MAG: hypothetical protein QE267_04980 [Akkermansiaceae bacterium]|nr:hypothetical protein [Akkermansiaceae bacterium]